MSETLQLTCPGDVDALSQTLHGYVAAGKRPNVTIEIEKKRRTQKQQNSLELFCKMVARDLNAAGLDMRVVLKPDAEIPWTQESVKNRLWRPLQEVMTGKESTTDPTTVEYQDIERVLAHHLSEKHGFQCPPWPSRDSQMREYQELQAAQNA